MFGLVIDKDGNVFQYIYGRFAVHAVIEQGKALPDFDIHSNTINPNLAETVK